MHVCVEVDLDKPLLPSTTMLGESQLVEYESLHLICFACGKYGHRSEMCVDKSSSIPQLDLQSGPTPEKPYGPWMLPKNPRRRSQGIDHHRWTAEGERQDRQPGDGITWPGGEVGY